MPHAPARANWLWLPGGLVAAAAITLAIVLHGGGHHATDTAATTAGHTSVSSSQPASGGHGGSAGSGGPTASSSASPGGGHTPGPGPSTSPRPSAPGGSGTGAGTGTPPGNTPAKGRNVRGEAVFYDPDSATGSCLLGPFPATGQYVSLPASRFANGAACGTYLDVTGPHGTVQAEVVDLCLSCGSHEINLSQPAFEAVAGGSAESASVSFAKALNPALHRPLALQAELSSAGLTALQILNHGNRLASVAVAVQRHGTAGAWHPLTLTAHGFWTAATPVAARRYAVRITDDQGHQVTLTGVRLTAGVLYRSGVWMYRSSTPATRSR